MDLSYFLTVVAYGLVGASITTAIRYYRDRREWNLFLRRYGLTRRDVKELARR